MPYTLNILLIITVEITLRRPADARIRTDIFCRDMKQKESCLGIDAEFTLLSRHKDHRMVQIVFIMNYAFVKVYLAHVRH